MKTVEYKFDLNQKVKTAFGDEGIVEMIGCNEGGNQYFVKTSNNGQWFKEDQLSAD